MSTGLLFIFSVIIKDTIRPSTPWLILKNPIVNTIKIYPAGSFKYILKGDTLYIKGVLKEGESVFIEYESFDIKKEYKINEIKTKEKGEEKKKINKVESEKKGENLYLKGNKEVGFKIEEGNFSIIQSTNLRVSGKIRKDVEIEGVFQDQSLPSEGTVSLSELEEAYFNIKSSRFKSKIGEFFLEERKIKRKILGIEGEGIGENFSFKAGTGYGKGTFQSVTIDVTPGKNGPYFIPLLQGERVVPGSEKVYLDGKLLKGGKEEDYIIDYEKGILTFTPRITLSSYSTVRIDFEKIEGGFDKYYLLMGNSTKVGVFDLNLLYFLERDMKESPLFSLSDSDKIFLKNTGDTSSVIYTKGYEYVGDGKGDYIKRGDTLIYAGRNKGDYIAYFSFVGENKGSYIFNDVIGGYEYVGEGKGDYIPRKVLYLPARKNFLSISSRFKKQNFEIFISEFDRNTYSPLHDGDNIDMGFKTNNNIFHKWGGVETGLNFTSRYFGKNLYFPFRENETNYEFIWMTKEREKYRWVMNPYLSLWEIFTLETERGYLKTDSGSVNRERYGFSFKRWLNINANYEEINNNKFNSEKLNTYRTRIHVFKKFKKYFAEYKYTFQNALSQTSDREVSLGLYNLFLSFSENIIHREIYVFSSSVHYRIKRKIFSTNGVLKYIFQKPYGGKKTGDYFYTIFSLLTPYPYLTLKVQLIKNPDIVLEKSVEYIFVGEGKGNFSYDSVSGTFYPDEDGSYIKRESFISQDKKAYREEIHTSMDFMRGPLSVFLTADRERKISDELQVLKNQRYTGSFIFNLPVYLSIYSAYSENEDREYYLEGKKKKSFTGSINARKKMKILTPEMGVEYHFDTESKIEGGLNVEEKEIKFIIGLLKSFGGLSIQWNSNLGINRKKSPLYFGKRTMKRTYFEIVPRFYFTIMKFRISNELRYTIQNVKNPLSNVSELEKEKWRIETRFSLSRKLKKNFEINLTESLRKGEKTRFINTLNFNFIAYF